MQPSGPQVIRVDPNTLLIICFRCGKHHPTAIEDIRATHTFRITCNCGQPYQFGGRERRRYTRKSVQLAGSLLDIETRECLDAITISNLSVSGLSLTTQQQPMQVDNKFIILFHLDDDDQTLMEESIVIRNLITAHQAGAELIESYSFDLDFYLNP